MPAERSSDLPTLGSPPEGTELDLRFERLWEEHAGTIAQYFRKRVRGDVVDDLVSETFLVVWRRLNTMPPGFEQLPWIFGVARRVLMGWSRAQRRRSNLESKLSQERFPGEISIDDELDVRVTMALSGLDRIDQEFLRLSYWEGKTPVEIAKAYDTSTNAATIRLCRARQRFALRFLALGPLEMRNGND